MSVVRPGRTTEVKPRRPTSIRVSSGGLFIASEPEINFIGATVANNTLNNRVDVTLTGQLVAVQQSVLDDKMDEAETINTQTNDYILQSTDFSTATLLIINKATGVNVTVAPGITTAGKSLRIRRINTGQITFIAGAAQNITSSLGSLVDAGQNGDVVLTYLGSNEWDLQNGFVNTAVPPTRTIAGVDLVDNITSSELNVALATMFSVQLVGSTNNRYHGSSIVPGLSSISTTTLATGSLKASPIYVGKNRTVDRIQAEVTTFGASSKLRLGIYADDGTGYPGALVVDSGEIDAGSNGVKNVTIAASLSPGLYWLACLGGTANCTYRAESSTCFFGPVFGFDQAMSSVVRQPYWVVAQAYGALPNPFTASGTVNTTSTNIPLILIRYSA